MKINAAQLKAIMRRGLDLSDNCITWNQTDDDFIYATHIDGILVTCYIFNPNGNSYRETNFLSHDGWDVDGWEFDD